jgi:hypothetical protein
VVPRKKKEVLVEPEVVQDVIVEPGAVWTHESAVTLWSNLISVPCAFTQFVHAFSLGPIVTVEDCERTASFLMCFHGNFPLTVHCSMYSWLCSLIHPRLVAWGITATSTIEFNRDKSQMDAFRRFMVLWGYAILQHKDMKKIPERFKKQLETSGITL